ncbi:transglycosylase domain-containing protein [Croceicoccus marinus]|jgi:penicillin-binding protein 1A|uniref:Transglycosylase domain-containing protein n=1 Tax=Croceicoccus marinus TaxID=450378 RepID=A0A7G6VVB1_9SPHN|nr:transglycosylase domain-containing protein [Croceicoccus marinus]QNE05676.1 transglycosylase domain-containing protein [Croceicoccus marinus]
MNSTAVSGSSSASRRSGGPLRWLSTQPRWLLALVAALLLLVGWQAWMAPPWRVGAPPGPAGVDYLAADGSLLAHRGERPVAEIDAAALPDHVRQAFLAIEDRRFYDHGGVDFRGLARATFDNLQAGGVVAGGSTITQQYVKNAFFTQDRTLTRKVQEMLLADWVESWASKDTILSRYLENCYFGEGQTGLTAAAHHYFSKTPQELSLGEAAMLAGMVKAPSRLAPTVDYEASAERMHVVLDAMAEAGFITRQQAQDVPDPELDIGEEEEPSEQAGWFVDWLAADLPEDFEGEVQTTLVPEIQSAAERAVRRARLGGSQVALLAIRPDGRVVAMVGGKEWTPEGFNRATLAERQPGSTFKLFDYFAAIRQGMEPGDMVTDAPVRIGNWQPRNGYRGYRGEMSLREAFAISSNTAAVRVADRAGLANVREAARDLGVTAELPDDASLALGSGSVTLKEMSAAYAAFAGGRYPVEVHGIEGQGAQPGRALDPESEWAPMLDLLWHAANNGTGRAAALGTPTFGKTGTSQEGRDALFIGFAGDLVTAVWVGRDDNAPVPGNSGGGTPAQIWRNFMRNVDLGEAELPIDPARLRRAPPPAAPIAPEEEDVPLVEGIEGEGMLIDPAMEGLVPLELDLPPPPDGFFAGPPPSGADEGGDEPPFDPQAAGEPAEPEGANP